MKQAILPIKLGAKSTGVLGREIETGRAVGLTWSKVYRGSRERD